MSGKSKNFSHNLKKVKYEGTAVADLKNNNWKQCIKHVVMILELFYEGSSYYCKCSDERIKTKKMLIKLREPEIMAF